MRIGLAFRSFFKLLFTSDQALADGVQALLEGKPLAALPATTTPPEPTVPPAAVQVLTLLQREGRLLDFLQEDLSGASDAQIGAVVRSTVWEKCRKAVQEYLVIEPVLAQKEGDSVTVETGFDPSAIRLIGRVEGDPPFQGKLVHPGWRVTQVKLPTLPEGSDTTVVTPAEVEIP